MLTKERNRQTGARRLLVSTELGRDTGCWRFLVTPISPRNVPAFEVQCATAFECLSRSACRATFDRIRQHPAPYVLHLRKDAEPDRFDTLPRFGSSTSLESGVRSSISGLEPP